MTGYCYKLHVVHDKKTIKIDGGTAENPKYKVDGDTGHFYTILETNDPTLKAREVFSYGPTIPGMPIWKGQIDEKDEIRIDKFLLDGDLAKNAAHIFKTVPLVKEQYQLALAKGQDIKANPDLYVIGLHDCMAISQTIWKSAGLKGDFADLFSTEELASIRSIAGRASHGMYGPGDERTIFLSVHDKETVAKLYGVAVEDVEFTGTVFDVNQYYVKPSMKWSSSYEANYICTEAGSTPAIVAMQAETDEKRLHKIEMLSPEMRKKLGAGPDDDCFLVLPEEPKNYDDIAFDAIIAYLLGRLASDSFGGGGGSGGSGGPKGGIGGNRRKIITKKDDHDKINKPTEDDDLLITPEVSAIIQPKLAAWSESLSDESIKLQASREKVAKELEEHDRWVEELAAGYNLKIQAAKEKIAEKYQKFFDENVAKLLNAANEQIGKKLKEIATVTFSNEINTLAETKTKLQTEIEARISEKQAEQLTAANDLLRQKATNALHEIAARYGGRVTGEQVALPGGTSAAFDQDYKEALARNKAEMEVPLEEKASSIAAQILQEFKVRNAELANLEKILDEKIHAYIGQIKDAMQKEFLDQKAALKDNVITKLEKEVEVIKVRYHKEFKTLSEQKSLEVQAKIREIKDFSRLAEQEEEQVREGMEKLVKHEIEFVKESVRHQENAKPNIPYYVPIQPVTFKPIFGESSNDYASAFRSFTDNIRDLFPTFKKNLFGQKDSFDSYLTGLGEKPQFSTGYETARGVGFNYEPIQISPFHTPPLYNEGRRVFKDDLEAVVYRQNKRDSLGIDDFFINDKNYDDAARTYGFGTPYEWRNTGFSESLAASSLAAGYSFLRSAPFATSSTFSGFAAAASSFLASGLRFVPRAFASLLPGIGQVMTAMSMVMMSRSAFAYATSHVSPLVLDLNGDGVKLYNIKQGVYFDYHNDGIAKRVGWISEHDGFLARDLDGNGRIDLIAELFGNDFMPAFLKLSILDTNNDNIIDHNDRDFSQLLIWQDVNRNGLSEYDEVHDLAHHKITKIYLNKQRVNESREGNYVVDRSEFEYEDGRKAEILDVLFENDPMDSYFVGKPGEDDEIIITPEVLRLPNLRGFGKLPELWIAMTKDKELKSSIESFTELAPNKMNEINEAFKKIIFRWAKTHEDLPKVRGDINIDPQELKFIEMFTAQTFKQLGVANAVGQHASDALSLGYKRVFNDLMSKFVMQSLLKEILPKAKYLVIHHKLELGSGLDEAITTAKVFADKNGYSSDFWALFSRVLINSHADLGFTSEQIRSKIFEQTGYQSWLDDEGNIVGDERDNVLEGTGLGDKIYGRSGNDKLSGKEGDDHIFGEDGDDYLAGDNGLDRLHGGEGADELSGGNDRDFLYGNEGGDRLYGEDGDDHLDGGQGNDFIDGGDGDDTLSFGDSKSKVRADLKLGKAYVGENEVDEFINCENIGGSEQDDYFVGDDNDNYINGEGGDDELHGGKGNDALFGATGNDVMYGEEGDDRLLAFIGSDLMDGGDGIDTVSYLHPYLKMGVKVDLQTGKGEGGAAEGDSYINIENIEGSRHDDVLIGNKRDNIIYGGEGNDEIYGASGNDTLNGGAGNNILHGGDGDDIIILGEGSNKIFGGSGDDIISYERAKKGVKIDMVAGLSEVTAIYQDSFSEIENVFGSNFADVIIGNDENNIINSLEGDDVINAGAGDDRIIGGEGSDKIDGGAGHDFVDYSREIKEAISINLAKKIFKGGSAEGDRLINVESIIATKFDDTLIGDDNDNQLYGLDGDDVIYGGGGNDIIIAGSGKNHLYGEDGNDIFFLGEGENTVKGGSDINGVNYKYARSKVEISLVDQRAKMQDLVVDVYEDIRDATGSEFDDVIIGNDAGNRLRGEGGDDYIQAGSWNSHLDGGIGNNTLIGGKGNDVFYVSQGSNNINGENGKDTLDYSEIGRKKYYDLVEREFSIRNKNNILPLSPNQNYSNPVLKEEGLVIDLTLAVVTKSNQLVDKFVGIENITGTHFDDVIIGDDGDNMLDGSGGNDTIKAGGGNDVLVAGYGGSKLYGEDGDDEFRVIDHGMADIYGGNGNDLIFLFSYHKGISIDLGNGYITYDDQHVRFACQDIENITGTKFADIIYDSIGNNVIVGGDGDNIIHASDGNDIITVGSGRDTIYLNGSGDKRITGGYGGNKYVIGSNFQSNKFASAIITDFMITGVKDVLDLSAYQMISSINDIKIAQLYEQDLKFAHITIAGDKELFLFDIEISKLSDNNFIFYGQGVENNDFSA